MRATDGAAGEWIELPGARLYYEPDFVSAGSGDSRALYETLVTTASWRQDEIQLFGKRQRIPRLSAWYGDTDAIYSYSGLRLEPMPWLAPLAWLRERLNRHLGMSFNSVLLNYYRDGADSMGAHSDDEPELGPSPRIAMVSLGAERRFVLTPRLKGAAQRWQRELADGSLLLMAGDCQRHWRHELPKTRRPVAGRISLTYRQIWGRIK